MRTILITFAVLLCVVSLRADDANEPEAPKKKPADDSLLDPEVQKELRKLIYGSEEKKEEDPLESAIRGMRSAKDKIAGKETGKETRDVQQKVIDDLQKLIVFAGLGADLDTELRSSPAFATNWATVKDWSVEHRYRLSVSARWVRDLLQACTTSGSGVLPWIRKRW